MIGLVDDRLSLIFFGSPVLAHRCFTGARKEIGRVNDNSDRIAERAGDFFAIVQIGTNNRPN